MTRETPAQPAPTDLVVEPGAKRKSCPIWLVREGREADALGRLTPEQRAWAKTLGFKGQARKLALVPAADGTLAGVLFGVGALPARERDGAPLLVGLLPMLLPAGTYHLDADLGPDATLAATAWGLGGYRYRRYKSGEADPLPALKLPRGVSRDAVLNTMEAIWLGRDLINMPANDLGPAEIEAAVRELGRRHGAAVTSTVGDALIAANLPLIHAVGRASPRAPRLVDMSWGRPDAPKLTIVGKGIAFDTGGLDLKPSSAMLLMKKDMGGAASAIALAHMVMGRKLDVRLRLLIPAAENSVSGTAFRPGDVIRSRTGRTVEIGNTDAEGRLVLADALAVADEEGPATLMTFATLTGAARVALGPELPALFCDDDQVAAGLMAAGEAVGDPVWRLPLTTPYESWLDSPIADMNNVAEGGFAGAIVGAMFLKRFVKRARTFAHFDVYGWRPAPKPLGPKGGEAQVARAVVEWLARQPVSA